MVASSLSSTQLFSDITISFLSFCFALQCVDSLRAFSTYWLSGSGEMSSQDPGERWSLGWFRTSGCPRLLPESQASVLEWSLSPSFPFPQTALGRRRMRRGWGDWEHKGLYSQSVLWFTTAVSFLLLLFFISPPSTYSREGRVQMCFCDSKPYEAKMSLSLVIIRSRALGCLLPLK